MAIQFRRGDEEDFAAENLLPGEPAYTLDTGRLYIGGESGAKEFMSMAGGTITGSLNVAGALQQSGNNVWHAGNLPIVDYVEEQGTSGIWQYRKWKSGTAECWGAGTLADVTSISGRGTYFDDTPVSIAYPSGLFTGGVVPHVALNPSTAFAVPSYTNFGAAAATFYILTPNEAQTGITVKYAIYAAGRWK